MSVRSLEDAIKECLADDGKISKYEARVIRELIMADGVVSAEERQFLEHALRNNQFDEQGYELLSGVLLRADLKE